MNNPLFRNYLSKMVYISVWVAITVIQALMIYLLADLRVVWVFVDSLVFNAFIAGLFIPLWYTVYYNRWKDSLLYLNVLLNVAIAFILICVWLGISYLMARLLGGTDPQYVDYLNKSLLWKAGEGILLYTIIVLIYYLCINRDKTDEKTFLSRIAVKDRKKIHIIPVQEIHYIEACGDYVSLHTGKGSYLKEQTMKYFEENLPSQQFVRIHRSFIINVNEVTNIELYEKESYRVHLKSGQQLKASINGYKILKDSVQL